MITANQIRNGRAMLGWKPKRLAIRSGLPLGVITLYEEGNQIFDPATLEILRTALESAGIEFIPENGSGSGVRLRVVA